MNSYFKTLELISTQKQPKTDTHAHEVNNHLHSIRAQISKRHHNSEVLRQVMLQVNTQVITA